MTRDEAVAEIKRQLAFRTTLDTTIVSWLQLAQTNLENAAQKPWWMKNTASLVTVASTETVAVPTGFIEENEDAVVRYIPTDTTIGPVNLVKDDLRILRDNYRDEDGVPLGGAPEAYALEGDYLYIFPLADDVYTIQFPYLKGDTLLTTNVANNWLTYFPMLIMGKAGKLATGGPLRDPIAYKIFSEWEQEGKAQLVQRINTRQLAGRSLQIGGPH